MNRRHWPVTLAIVSIVILGSYLLYTEHLVRLIRREASIHTRMFGLVQRGLLAPPDDEGEAALAALIGLQDALHQLGVPIILVSTAGEPVGAVNLPFEFDLSNPEDRHRVLEYAARLARQNDPVLEPSAGIIYFGSPPILGWLRWVPWLQVGGAVLLLVVSASLIRADLRAERERFWAAMARELAHQRGTPLSSLAGWIEVLRLPPEQRTGMITPENLAEEVAADVERLERVSRRFELIGKRPALGPVPVAALVRDLEAYLRPRLPRLASGIEVSVRVQEDLPPVLGNRVLLAWALENVIKNALDALAGRGGRIRVIAYRGDEDTIRMYVTDTGPGIPPSQREAIFQPGVSTKPGGWGVGLSLTRRIIEDVHGGRIVASGRRGGGAIFEIELPVDGAAKRDRWTWLRRMTGLRTRSARRRRLVSRSAG